VGYYQISIYALRVFARGCFSNHKSSAVACIIHFGFWSSSFVCLFVCLSTGCALEGVGRRRLLRRRRRRSVSLGVAAQVALENKQILRNRAFTA
jgi:hypothetical protein